MLYEFLIKSPLIGCEAFVTSSLLWLALSFFSILGWGFVANRTRVSSKYASTTPFEQRHALVVQTCNRLFHTFKTHLPGLAYLIRGPSIIEAAYARSPKKSFVVSTPSNNHVMITSPAAIRELANAPNDVLSLHAIAHELLQPRHTMRGFEWKDQRGVEGTGFVRALRGLLTSNLPILLPRLQNVLAETFDTQIHSSLASQDQGHLLNVFPTIKKVVARTNCVMFFGEELSKQDDFVMAALQFPQDVIFAAEFLRLSPAIISPLVAYITTNGHKAAKILVDHLTPVVEARMKLRSEELGDKALPKHSKPVDCMQWIIDTSSRKDAWPASRMIGELIALWFGSVHQLAMVGSFALDHLSTQPDAAEVLRQELRLHEQTTASSLINVDELPLLNSFLMEASRISSSDAVSCRRKALKKFTFSDSTVVEPGNWACVPLLAILHDAKRYTLPDQFDIHRFVTNPGGLLESRPRESLDYCDARRFTDVTAKWPIWGIGKTSCPGRFYASCILKLLLIHVVSNYEVRMRGHGRRSMSWRSSIVPLGSAKLEFVRRKE